ncbi:ATP-binding protein [Adlercreutzia sp. ZJ242]|uniref:ATP-binding protein n=1 Tax=Adlercreutzia sp. ZJ242 TaxID=2709409 RepID=UPI0019822D51|nr:ATP-binding protein [Adlercreutzia sp. ZJ242]
MGNGQIKVITGVRRCGKSFLVFRLFREYLKEIGVPDDHVIEVALDDDDNEKLRDVGSLSRHIKERILEQSGMYYVLLDEVQLAITREEMRNPDVQVRLYGLLNSLMRKSNVDIYATGSNSKMLSKDVATEFRGRGDVVEVHPLSFSEYYSYVGGDKVAALDSFLVFGGMPLVLAKNDAHAKREYLKSLFNEVYMRDIVERYEIERPSVLSELAEDLCSSVGSLTNANKISRTLKTVRGTAVDNETIAAYLNHLTESFLFRCARRYDVKGKRYFEFPSKYYCEDVGLRNAWLGFRQQEETHLMENVIYNELVTRGYAVDVGVVEVSEKDGDGKLRRKKVEIDFVATKAPTQVYIQSALSVENPDKARAELRPLLAVRDFFRKVVVSKTTLPPWVDDSGIIRMGIYDFLLDETLLS